jgi:ABC-type transporter Mla subunit MlaD
MNQLAQLLEIQSRIREGAAPAKEGVGRAAEVCAAADNAQGLFGAAKQSLEEVAGHLQTLKDTVDNSAAQVRHADKLVGDTTGAAVTAGEKARTVQGILEQNASGVPGTERLFSDARAFETATGEMRGGIDAVTQNTEGHIHRIAAVAEKLAALAAELLDVGNDLDTTRSNAAQLEKQAAHTQGVGTSLADGLERFTIMGGSQ